MQLRAMFKTLQLKAPTWCNTYTIHHSNGNSRTLKSRIRKHLLSSETPNANVSRDIATYSATTCTGFGPQHHARQVPTTRASTAIVIRQLTTKASNEGTRTKAPKGRRNLLLVSIPTAAVVLYLVYDHLTTPPVPLLHPRIFTPFTLISREKASSISDGASCDSAIFTFRADTVTSNPAVDGFFQIPSSWVGRGLLSSNGGWADHGGGWSSFWNRGIWSVEFKQPMLQIARRYTPLPMDHEDDGGNDFYGTAEGGFVSGTSGEKDVLRFLIKRESEGEVSRWLFALDIGSTVWFRGPGWEWVYPSWLRGGHNEDGNVITARQELKRSEGRDENAEIERPRSIAFLAGGTGIAPALQLAAAVRRLPRTSLPTNQPNLSILWAVRAPKDIPPQVKNYLDYVQKHTIPINTSGKGGGGFGDAGVGKGGRIHTSYHVDSLRTYITKVDISHALGLSPGEIPDSPPLRVQPKQGSWGSWFSSAPTSARQSSSSSSLPSSSSSSTSSATPNPPKARRETEAEPSGGDKVVLISGPDGFIRYFTGAKMEDGSQGKVTGLVKEIIGAGGGSGSDDVPKKNNPHRRRWFVWKM